MVLGRLLDQWVSAWRRGVMVPAPLPDGAHLHSDRISFCSDLDGARRRFTPPSVRFLGRRVDLFAAFLLTSVLRNDVNEFRAAQLEGPLHVSEKTLRRWRHRWLESFPTTYVWRELRGRFVPQIANADLPRALLDRSTIDSVAERALKLLELQSPARFSFRPPRPGRSAGSGTDGSRAWISIRPAASRSRAAGEELLSNPL